MLETNAKLREALGIEKMSSLEVEAFLDKEYKAPGGVEKFAAAMAGVIYEDLLYEGRIRQCMEVYKASPGEDVTFDADVQTPAVRLSVQGLPELLNVKSNRVRVDTSPSAVKTIIRWNEINYRKFDIVERTYQRMKSGIMIAEDTRGISVIDTASSLFHTPITYTSTTLLAKLAQAKATMVKARIQPTRILMSPLVEQYLLILVNGTSPIYAPNTQEALLKQGKIGSIFGLEIVVSDLVADNTLYLLGPKEYVGRIAVRTDIDTKTHPHIPSFGDMIVSWIDEGFLVRYSKGILKLSF